MSLPFDQQVTLTSKTYFPTFTGGSGGCLHLLISKWHWLQGGLSLPFDQQVTLNPNTCPNFRCGGVSALAENSFCSIQELSPPWQRTPFAASGRFLCLLISKWHWLQKPKFQLSLVGVVSTFWSAGDTDFKNLSLGVYTFWSGCLHLWVSLLITVSPPFDQQVTLTSKT